MDADKRATEAMTVSDFAWDLQNDGDHAACIEYYSRAIALAGAYVDAYINRGVAYDKTLQHQRALDDYAVALALDPTSVDALNNKGIAHKNLGQFRLAIAAYNKAIRLDPEN